MTERDMADLVAALLRKRLRQMALPAALGVGLSLAGCGSEAVVKYGAPNYEAGAHDTRPVVKYGAQFPDGSPVVKYMAPFDAGRADDRIPDAGRARPAYAAHIPDSGH